MGSPEAGNVLGRCGYYQLDTFLGGPAYLEGPERRDGRDSSDSGLSLQVNPGGGAADAAGEGLVNSNRMRGHMRREVMLGACAIAALAAGVAVLVDAPSADAHHAFAAEFDAEAPIRLEGTVVRVEWVNPHTWIHINVVDEDGERVWMVEGGTPNVLARRGLRRDCLPAGTELIVDGYQARDHSLARANARNVTFRDGRRFFVGSLGTGAPYEQATEVTADQPC